MVSFVLSIAALFLGYMVYGHIVERIFGPDDRVTPAVTKANGVDFVVLPNWKVFMIQFLNIAGTGTIFGAIMGAKFGPSSYLWIVFGSIFAGSVHDYMAGMLSMRHGGANLDQLARKYLGEKAHHILLVFMFILLVILGVVFVSSPAVVLAQVTGYTWGWIALIFAYFFISTITPIDKIIGKIYPFFAICMLFMCASLLVMLFIKMPDIPEFWDGMASRLPGKGGSIFPCLFITIACGALSGFHATQSPIMARCLQSERMGRPVFYGAMITEGLVALVWAAASSYFFYGKPTAGYLMYEASAESGMLTSAPQVVYLLLRDWLGIFGGIIAILGVVVCPISSGDTAFRSARMIVADGLKIDQVSRLKRVMVAVPIFAIAIGILIWQQTSPDGFNLIWQHFGLSNQAIGTFALWVFTVSLARNGKFFYITLLPALFMTWICTSFLVSSDICFGFSLRTGYIVGTIAVIVALDWFLIWYRRFTMKHTWLFYKPKNK